MHMGEISKVDVSLVSVVFSLEQNLRKGHSCLLKLHLPAQLEFLKPRFSGLPWLCQPPWGPGVVLYQRCPENQPAGTPSKCTPQTPLRTGKYIFLGFFS